MCVPLLIRVPRRCSAVHCFLHALSTLTLPCSHVWVSSLMSPGALKFPHTHDQYEGYGRAGGLETGNVSFPNSAKPCPNGAGNRQQTSTKKGMKSNDSFPLATMYT